MAKMETLEVWDEIDRETRVAEIWDSVEERHLVDLGGRWKESLEQLLAWAPKGHREESSHWNWPEKLNCSEGIFGRQAFVIEVDRETQAVMLLDFNHASRIRATKGESIVYVDYLESAPWNRRYWQPNRRFRRFGSVLLQVAVQQSIELGFDGRVGLHSLPDSEAFYRRLDITEFWRDPDYQCLTYFEMTSTQAATLLTAGGMQ